MSTVLNTSDAFPSDFPELPDYWDDTSRPPQPAKQSTQNPPVPAPTWPRPHAGSATSALPVLMAVADSVLAPEVATVVAATGRAVIDTIDPRDIARLSNKVAVVLADESTAPVLTSVPQSVTKVLLFAEPGPVDFELAMRVHADHALVVPAQAPELLEIIGRFDTAAPRRGERGFVTAVIGAVGGAGASTVAAALTQAQADVTLIDAVPESGGLDLLLGVEESAGVRFNDVALTTGTIAANDLKNALPHLKRGQAVLTSARLSNDELHSDEIAVAIDLLSTTGDVVVDCPYQGEETATVVEKCDHIVIIVPSEIRAVARAKTLVERLRRARVDCSIIIRHRAWSGLSTQEIETITGAVVIAELPTIKKLAKTAEIHGLDGAIPPALKKCAEQIMRHTKVGSA